MDYLGRLVFRARQPDLAVQPRLSSRFERPQPATLEPPGPAMPGAAEPSTARPPDIAEFDHSTIGSTWQYDRVRGPDLPPRSVTPEPRAPRPTDGPALVTVPQLVPEPRSRQSPGQPSGRDVWRALTATEAAPAEPSPIPTDVVRPADVERFSAAPGLEPGRPPAVGPPVVPIRLAQERERPIRPAVRASEGDLPAAVLSGGRRDRDRPPSHDHVDRRQPSALGERPGTEVFPLSVTPALALRDEGRAQTPEKPTIQVSIGRVEIRATVVPTPVRKTTARPPAMSLDEYLKRRNEASR